MFVLDRLRPGAVLWPTRLGGKAGVGAAAQVLLRSSAEVPPLAASSPSGAPARHCLRSIVSTLRQVQVPDTLSLARERTRFWGPRGALSLRAWLQSSPMRGSSRRGTDFVLSGDAHPKKMLKTPLCDDLGIEYPIFSVGFGPSAGPELAAAVSNAGACGCLGSGRLPPDYLREQIRKLRNMTSKPFGVNVVLHFKPVGVLEACLEEGVPLLVLFLGDTPRAWVVDAHRNGARVFMQVGSVAEAKAAADAGVDAIIAQGFEAGGHVRGRTPLMTLVPTTVDAVKPLPVVAAGGVADGRGIVAALSLGAQGVHMGTRFVASEEANIALAYKQRVVAAGLDDLVYCEQLFDKNWPNAPHRVIRNRVVAEWEAAGRPPSGQRPGEGTVIGTVTRGRDKVRTEVARYAPTMLTSDFEGDVEYGPLWAGDSCALVNEIQPAAQIVANLVSEARSTITKLNVP